jgi:hypothetical protein
MRPVRLLLLAILSGCLGGCVIYPRTAQPGITFHVEDDSGKPVTNALVTVSTYLRGFCEGHDAAWTEVKTNDAGIAVVPKKMELALFFAAPEGGSCPLDWAWCVEKKGYRPVMVNALKTRGLLKLEAVTLEKSGPPWEATWITREHQFVLK